MLSVSVPPFTTTQNIKTSVLPTEPLEKCREGQRHFDQERRQLPANDKAARRGLSWNLTNVPLHPDVAGDGVFEREFDLVGGTETVVCPLFMAKTARAKADHR